MESKRKRANESSSDDDFDLG
jgi:hypothetical protein